MKHFYYVTFVVVMPNGAVSWAGGEMGLAEPITRVQQVQAMQKSIASKVQARDDQGRVVIGAPSPAVVVMGWEFLRVEEQAKDEDGTPAGSRLVS